MIFEPDDIDWAFGELLALFDRANRIGIYPHELNAEVFYEAWALLNTLPFPVRQKLLGRLLARVTRPLHNIYKPGERRRYAYVVTH